MRRYLAAALISLATVTPSFAADAADAAAAAEPAKTVVALGGAPAQSSPNFATSILSTRRPNALLPLYAASFALQGYDAYSTLSAVNAGGREANPLMKSVVGSPVAFTAVKVGTAAATFMLSERLWKTNHRAAAVAVMAASNLGMTMVAMNNARVLASLK